MADILIYGKLKNASGGKLADYAAIDGAPEIAQTSGESSDKVMSQLATMEAIRQAIKDFAPLHFCGEAYSADTNASGGATALYKQGIFSISFPSGEGDAVSIPGTDGETGYLGVITAPEGYAYTINGLTTPNAQIYKTTKLIVILYDQDGGFTTSDLVTLDGVSVTSLVFEEDATDQKTVYSKTVTAKIIPSRGDVWQLGEREHAYNGTEWVELGFNFSADLSGVYTKAEADALFATKTELTSKIAAAMGTAEAALAEV